VDANDHIGGYPIWQGDARLAWYRRKDVGGYRKRRIRDDEGLGVEVWDGQEIIPHQIKLFFP
jgi:hypothetical protein